MRYGVLPTVGDTIGPGGVFRLVRRDFRWGDAPPISILAQTESDAPRQMRLYALERPLTREEQQDELTLAPNDLVGRDAEKADLSAAFHRAANPGYDGEARPQGFDATDPARPAPSFAESDEALDARVEAGVRSPQHAANMKEEMPAPRNVRIARADTLFEDGLDLELGGVTVQVRHVGGDHAAYELLTDLVGFLEEKGHEVTNHGPHSYDAVDDYPVFVLRAAEAVAADPGSRGIVLGGSGNGEQMAANKVAGIRAALCHDDELARLFDLTRDVLLTTESRDAVAVLDLFGQCRPEPQQLPEQAAPHLQRTPRHDVVERRHALEQGDVLERAGDAPQSRLVGTHVRTRPAPERDAAMLGLIEAVDDIEHRRLARAVRADNGADLALADIE